MPVFLHQIPRLFNEKLIPLDVKVGDTVMKEQELGKSGMTGLAGGDHAQRNDSHSGTVCP